MDHDPNIMLIISMPLNITKLTTSKLITFVKNKYKFPVIISSNSAFIIPLAGKHIYTQVIVSQSIGYTTSKMLYEAYFSMFHTFFDFYKMISLVKDTNGTLIYADTSKKSLGLWYILLLRDMCEYNDKQNTDNLTDTDETNDSDYSLVIEL